MKKTLLLSDSLIGSLCREIDFIRTRYKAINSLLIYCKDKSLRTRLFNELDALITRKNELSSISSLFNKDKLNLSNQFLLELCKRSL